MLHNSVYKLPKVYTNDTWHLSTCSRTPASCKVNCKHMTLAISMLNNVLPLYTKTQNWHFKHPIVLR